MSFTAADEGWVTIRLQHWKPNLGVCGPLIIADIQVLWRVHIQEKA